MKDRPSLHHINHFYTCLYSPASVMVQVSTVKSVLEGWREPVIHLDALLGWEKDFYPAITAGILTLKFIFYWYWDPTLITFFALMGLCLTLCDFIGPKILGQVINKTTIDFALSPVCLCPPDLQARQLDRGEGEEV